jgi:hypothetical protein
MIHVNLVHNIPGTFTVQSERLYLNDGVNFSLNRNPFTRQIARPTFNKTYDSVEETIVLNITGDSYAAVQNNMDLLVEKLERVARFNAGEHNGGLMLEVLLSGTSNIQANKAYAARILDYTLTLPEDEMQYRNLRVIKDVQLMIKRGPFYDAYAYANIPTSNVYTGSTLEVPGIITFSGILPVKNSSSVQLKVGDFSSGIKASMPEVFYVSTNSSANAIYDLVASRENLCINPSFEVNTTGWNAPTFGASTLSQSTDWDQTGSYSLKITPVAPYFRDGAITLITGLTPGLEYTGSLYGKFESGVTYFTEWLYDAGPSSHLVTESFVGTGASQRVSLTLTAQQSAYSFGIVKGASGTAPFYIDSVLVERGNTVRGYMDGDQPFCSWVGTAHYSKSQSLQTNFTDVVDATAVGASYASVTVSGGQTVTLVQNKSVSSVENNYPDENAAKSAMVFATITVSGTASLKAGIVLEENDKRFLTSPSFFSDITVPEVVYVGQIETLGVLDGVVCLEVTAYNEPAVVNIDTLTFVANDSMYTQVFKVLPSTPPTTTSSLFVIDPVLGAYGPTSQFLNTDFRPKVIYGRDSDSLKTTFQFGSALDFLPVVGADCLTYKTETSFNDATVNDNMYLIVLATGGNGDWTLRTDAGGAYALDAEAAVIPAYPYLPRL